MISFFSRRSLRFLTERFSIAIIGVSLLCGCGRDGANSDTAKDEPIDSQPGRADAVEGTGGNSTAKESTSRRAAGPRPVVFGAELVKVLDFSKWNWPEGTNVFDLSPARANLAVPGTVKANWSLFLAKFNELGWKSLGGAREQITDAYASTTLGKDNFLAEISISKMGDGPETMVSLLWHGNLDARKLPRLQGGTPIFEEQSATGYRLEMKVPEALAETLKLLAADGWKPFDKNKQHKQEPSNELATAKVLKDGYEMDVMIGTVPNKANTTHVQYNVYALSHDVPVPSGAFNIEYDDAKWELHCESPGDFLAVAEFYKEALLKSGCKVLPSEKPEEKYFNQRFGSEFGDVLLVQTSRKDDHTRVLFTGITAAQYQAILKHTEEDEKAAKSQQENRQSSDDAKSPKSEKKSDGTDFDEQFKKQRQEIEDQIKAELKKALSTPAP